MAPVIREIEYRNWPLVLIHTGQHKEGIEELKSDFQIKTDWQWLYSKDQEVKTISHAFKWLLSLISAIILKPNSLLAGLNSFENNIILVHGDTFSTILGALLGKRIGIKVAHVESGLRSFNFLNPFPEEINRIITFYLADIAFCPGQWAVNNLNKYKKLIKIDTENNTLLDSLKIALDFPYRNNNYPVPTANYGVVSIHRFENIFYSTRFKSIIDQLIEVADKHHLIFVLHPTTHKRLIRSGLIENLNQHPGIELRERTGYINFIHLLVKSQFVITDGGSNQEELSYLNIPTFLMRKTTERQEGLGSNVQIGNISADNLRKFIRETKTHSNKQLSLPINSPSRIICNEIAFATTNFNYPLKHIDP
ncbi:UDP-N-acetylglucosamine 2-epimerase [Methyloglobulus morosus]|nr:UDP-N-acetylglucosamine 2-epimerase [Methyloglobulus morosus]